MASASKSSEQASSADKSVQAFRDALEKSITISLERLQEVLDDAVKRGRMTRGDAEDLVGRLVTKSRDQAEEIRKQLEPQIVAFRGLCDCTVKATAKKYGRAAYRKDADAVGRYAQDLVKRGVCKVR